MEAKTTMRFKTSLLTALAAWIAGSLFLFSERQVAGQDQPSSQQKLEELTEPIDLLDPNFAALRKALR